MDPKDDWSLKMVLTHERFTNHWHINISLTYATHAYKFSYNNNVLIRRLNSILRIPRCFFIQTTSLWITISYVRIAWFLYEANAVTT